MKLYHMAQAPNPRRVRIFLAEKGIDIEKVEVDIPSGENLEPDFLAINPRGLLPTLVLDDGSVIDETIAICRYFEEIQPEPILMGHDPLSKAQIESWQRHIEWDGLLQVADVFRNTAPHFKDRPLPGSRSTGGQISDLIERGKAGTKRFYKRLNERLGKSKYVGGEDFSIADITAVCTVDFSRWVKLCYTEEAHPHIHRWYSEVSQRPSMKA